MRWYRLKASWVVGALGILEHVSEIRFLKKTYLYGSVRKLSD